MLPLFPLVKDNSPSTATSTTALRVEAYQYSADSALNQNFLIRHFCICSYQKCYYRRAISIGLQYPRIADQSEKARKKKEKC
ncbi:MAG: hypothetical protein CMQ19_10170 [Gammaproteobacteria bacterium]|nr:hypothetical protein [Gammaproteobacteria bacterium]